MSRAMAVSASMTRVPSSRVTHERSTPTALPTTSASASASAPSARSTARGSSMPSSAFSAAARAAGGRPGATSAASLAMARAPMTRSLCNGGLSLYRCAVAQIGDEALDLTSA